MDRLIFHKVSGKLNWGNLNYNATAGPYGKASLPSGDYEINVEENIPNPSKFGFKDKLTGEAWFIPLASDFESGKTLRGIHPDGGSNGTIGCIGIRGTDADKFWKRWNQTAETSRPSVLEVK